MIRCALPSNIFENCKMYSIVMRTWTHRQWPAVPVHDSASIQRVRSIQHRRVPPNPYHRHHVPNHQHHQHHPIHRTIHRLAATLRWSIPHSIHSNTKRTTTTMPHPMTMTYSSTSKIGKTKVVEICCARFAHRISIAGTGDARFGSRYVSLNFPNSFYCVCACV